MKLYRFMSVRELQDLLTGKPLVNTTDQNKDRGKKSTAVGFCFGIGDYEQAVVDFRRLNGIVTPGFLVVFEPKDIKNFTKCKGRYCDYEATEKKYGNLWNCPFGEEETKWYDEYCTTIYSRKRDLKENFEVYQITDAWEELKTKRIV